MIRWLFLLALCFASPAYAQNDDAAIRGIVHRIYKGYAKADGGGVAPRLSVRLAAVRRECAALGAKLDRQKGADSSYGTCSNDYDFYCQCQDAFGIDFAGMKTDVTFPTANRAEAVLQWGNEAPDLKLIFVRARGGWVLDDGWEYSQTEGGGEPSHRKRLVRDIAAMRTTLKLPVWKEPGL